MTHVMDAAGDGVLLSLKLTDDSLAKERCFKGREKIVRSGFKSSYIWLSMKRCHNLEISTGFKAIS